MPSNKKIILGLVGEMGSGKSTATEYLREKYGAVTFRFSDMLRDILKRVQVEPLRGNLQALSTFLRQNFSENIMSRVLAQDVEASDAQFIITEGIRRPSDIEYLAQLPGFVLVALQVDERTRYERIATRRENPDDAHKTWEQFQKEGQQEAEQKIKEIMRMAQYQIDNNGTKENLRQQIDAIMEKIV